MQPKVRKRVESIARLAIVAVVVGAVAVATAEACSTFHLVGSETAIFGKNYDWSVGAGLLVVNKRGMSKRAMWAEHPAEWTSTHGSLTFNQYGREMPSGGMNESGLIVELMWLEESRYPDRDKRPAIGKMQWIQYQLDVSATVADVIASDVRIRIDNGGAGRVHYLVADATGDRASIEFIDGVMVAHRGEDMPAPVLTNSTYVQSASHLERYIGFGGDRAIPTTLGSLDRFVRAAHLVRTYDPHTPIVEYGFSVLRDVAQGTSTMWSIIYDIDQRRVHFRTVNASTVRYVDMDDLDFSCETGVTVLDVRESLNGNVSDRFEPYTRDINYAVIREACRGTSFLRHLNDKTLIPWAAFPENAVCAPAGETVTNRE
jgi:choloylglycine hydrolase